MKINFFKTKKNFKKKSSEPNPNFYWKIVVGLAFVLIISSAIFGYQVFNQIEEDSASLIENAGKKQPVEKERLKKVLEYFSLREEKSNQIINSTILVVDPSL